LAQACKSITNQQCAAFLAQGTPDPEKVLS